MSDPKDLVVEGKPRVIKDKEILYGKYAGKQKRFSDVVESDFEYCLELVRDFKNMKEFYQYIIETDKYLDYEDEQYANEQKNKGKK